MITRRQPKIVPKHFTVSGDNIFFSIQGEGPCLGMPAVFFRLHLCNLSCDWCDTPYTWNESHEEYWTEWRRAKIAQIANEIEKYPCKHLVITGGEPLLQQRAIGELLELLPNHKIEIETNGTVSPSEKLSSRCHFNVSPKLTNSGVAESKRIKAEALAHFAELPQAIFKFVACKNTDLDEVEAIRHEFKIPPEKIVIMPEGKSSDELNCGLRSLVETCKERGFRLLPRMHVQIWGSERRV